MDKILIIIWSLTASVILNTTFVLALEKDCMKNPKFCTGDKILPFCDENKSEEESQCTFVQQSEGQYYQFDLENGNLKEDGVVIFSDPTGLQGRAYSTAVRSTGGRGEKRHSKTLRKHIFKYI